jgi:hypothetical protein
MARKYDLKLNLCESVDNATANKISSCLCRYTNNQIKIFKMTASDSFDTNYRYDIYIDGNNQYMKKMPKKAEINNIEQFCNGIIYTMTSF